MAGPPKKAEYIKVPETPGFPQTEPVEPEQRIAESDISVKPCDVSDAEKIAEGLYTCFPEGWWAPREPPALRPPEQSTRVKRLAKRLVPSLSHPGVHFIKAVLTSTGDTVGIAGWYGPGLPAHNIWRRSAADFYGWNSADPPFWTAEEYEDIWSGTNMDHWDNQFSKDDAVRADLLPEPHWYLAPLFTFPEYQGRGVGKLLLDWAIKQADATEPVTPMYLESAPYARAVYMHVGFVPVGKVNFIRRGPAVVKGLEASEEERNVEPEVTDKTGVMAVEKEVGDSVA